LLIDKLHPLTGAPGLAAAVYTQTTDVEIEVNGLMTYDRALVKMDAERSPPPTAPADQHGPHRWQALSADGRRARDHAPHWSRRA
jgi:hypothetical protein